MLPSAPLRRARWLGRGLRDRFEHVASEEFVEIWGGIEQNEGTSQKVCEGVSP